MNVNAWRDAFESDAPLSAVARAVLNRLAGFPSARTEGTVYASAQWLASRMKRNEKTVRRAILEAVDRGWLAVERQENGTQGGRRRTLRLTWGASVSGGATGPPVHTPGTAPGCSGHTVPGNRAHAPTTPGERPAKGGRERKERRQSRAADADAALSGDSPDSRLVEAARFRVAERVANGKQPDDPDAYLAAVRARLAEDPGQVDRILERKAAREREQAQAEAQAQREAAELAQECAEADARAERAQREREALARAEAAWRSAPNDDPRVQHLALTLDARAPMSTSVVKQKRRELERQALVLELFGDAATSSPRTEDGEE